MPKKFQRKEKEMEIGARWNLQIWRCLRLNKNNQMRQKTYWKVIWAENNRWFLTHYSHRFRCLVQQ